jgi:DNA-binding beta-propeller fold protein YncE
MRSEPIGWNTEGWRISSVAGSGVKGYAGDRGPAVVAALNNPFDIAFDPEGRLVFSDTFNHCLRRIDLRSGVIVTIAGTGQAGYGGDGGPAAAALFNEPYGVAIDRAGTIYTADRLNRRVRRIDGASGVVRTLAGTGELDHSGAEGAADRIGLAEPNGLALSPDQSRLFIADVADNRVHVVDLASLAMTIFAGTGEGAHTGDGGPAAQAAIFGARAVAAGADDSVFVLERQGGTLRRVDPGTGIIETMAGTGARGYSGDGGPALQSTFDRPKELALIPGGDLLVVDTENHAIRFVTFGTGLVHTIAGNGQAGYSGEDVSALTSCLARPHGAAVGPDGAIYIADSENHRVRKLVPASGGAN